MNPYHSSPPPPHRPQPPPTFKLRQNPEKMSLTQTFYLAHKARGKLSSEASRQDHNLRLLVGHANLLDTLMIHLSEAERDQERWFNNMVRGNEESRESQEFPETIQEESEEYGSLATDYDTESDTSSESDDDGETEDMDFSYPLLAREASFVYPSTTETLISVSELDEDYEEAGDDTEEEDEDEDEDGMYSLTRTTSRRPPSLCSDYSDEEEEESNPPSPPQPTIPHPPLSHKQRAYFVGQHGSAQPPSLFDEVPVYFEPQQSPPPIISTF